jgi:Family of unknown function (DUF6059)
MRKTWNAVRRFLSRATERMIVFGKMWVYIPPAEDDFAHPPHPNTLRGPGPGHPERLCPDVPLTGPERELLRQLGL